MIPTEVAEIAIALAKALGTDMDAQIALASRVHRLLNVQGWKLEKQP